MHQYVLSLGTIYFLKNQLNYLKTNMKDQILVAVYAPPVYYAVFVFFFIIYYLFVLFIVCVLAPVYCSLAVFKIFCTIFTGYLPVLH